MQVANSSRPSKGLGIIFVFVCCEALAASAVEAQRQLLMTRSTDMKATSIAQPWTDKADEAMSHNVASAEEAEDVKKSTAGDLVAQVEQVTRRPQPLRCLQSGGKKTTQYYFAKSF